MSTPPEWSNAELDLSAANTLASSSPGRPSVDLREIMAAFDPKVWSMTRAYGLSGPDAEEVYLRTWYHYFECFEQVNAAEGGVGAWIEITAEHEARRFVTSRSLGHVVEVSRAARTFARLYGIDAAGLSRRIPPAPRSRSAWSLTSWASRLAGRGRDVTQWRAHLAGVPEEGIVLTPREQQRAAVGFLVAAVRYRLHDLLGGAWRPVDWLLAASNRTNAFISTVVGAQAIYIVGDDGLSALVTEVWEPCGVAGASLYAFARYLRRVRGIELAASGRGSDSD